LRLRIVLNREEEARGRGRGRQVGGDGRAAGAEMEGGPRSARPSTLSGAGGRGKRRKLSRTASAPRWGARAAVQDLTLQAIRIRRIPGSHEPPVAGASRLHPAGCTIGRTTTPPQRRYEGRPLNLRSAMTRGPGRLRRSTAAVPGQLLERLPSPLAARLLVGLGEWAARRRLVLTLRLASRSLSTVENDSQTHGPVAGSRGRRR
jgi:hypothetical protein